MAVKVPLKVESGVVRQFATGDTLDPALLTGVALLTGATFTGDVTIDKAGAAMVLDADAATMPALQFKESGTLKAQLAQDYTATVVGQDDAFFFQNASNGAGIFFLGKTAGGADRFLAQLTSAWQALYYDNTATFQTISGGIAAGDGTNWVSILKSSTTAVIQNNDDGLINLRGSTNICISANPAGVVSIYNNGTERIRAGSTGVLGYGTTHQLTNASDSATTFTLVRTDATAARNVLFAATGAHYQDQVYLQFSRPHTNGGAVASTGFLGTTSDNNLKLNNYIDGGEVWVQADSSGGTTTTAAKFSATLQSLLYNGSPRLRTANTVGAESSLDGTNWFTLMQVSGGQRITIGTSTPASPAVGDLWVDTN